MSHRCFNCGGDLTSRRETRRYGRGIDVVLVGVEVRHCDDCGEEEVVIPRIKELHNAIAADLANRPGILSPGKSVSFELTWGSRARILRSTWESHPKPCHGRRPTKSDEAPTNGRQADSSFGQRIQFKDYELPNLDKADQSWTRHRVSDWARTLGTRCSRSMKATDFAALPVSPLKSGLG